MAPLTVLLLQIYLLEIVFFAFTVFYSVCLLWLILQWHRIPVFSTEDQQKAASSILTVIIPVRNEAENITCLLRDLSAQQGIANGCFEVIVVDDHSEDRTVSLVEKYGKDCHFPLYLISLNMLAGSCSHKKMAIAQAVAQSKGKIIITTDGDCRVGAYWLASFVQFFEKHQAAFVSGPVTFHHEYGLFQHLQTIEFASLIGTGAVSMYAQMPNMCNGANLAFTKEAFLAVNGYEGTLHIPSGDDEFLMRKIFKQYPGHVYFMKSDEAIVYTDAKSGLLEFYHQRRRWSGKWKLHKNAGVIIVAIFVFTYHSLLLIAFAMAILGQFAWMWLAIPLLIKCVLEYVFLNHVMRFMKKRIGLLHFITLEFIYPPYVVFFGICANFGSYTWKNRTYT